MQQCHDFLLDLDKQLDSSLINAFFNNLIKLFINSKYVGLKKLTTLLIGWHDAIAKLKK